MRTVKFFIIILGVSLIYSIGFSQKFVSGFQKEEFKELLRVSARQLDTPWTSVKLKPPTLYQINYRSPEMGLKNRWDLWLAKDSVAVISIRGTVADPVSWLENFYAVMVPAMGSIRLSDSLNFEYKLADHPKAAVHIGWLIGMAYLSRDILKKIDSCYKKGIKHYYIMGFSQGGAIAYLLNSYFYYLKKDGKILEDIHFKTYCSAAPKPGNLYYAYDYEYITQNGMAYNVVSAPDWVPETPLTIQTKDDFNPINPFQRADTAIKKQRFPKKMIIKMIYNRLNRPSKKGLKRYKKYLGIETYKMVRKNMPAYKMPVYFNSMNYQRAGSFVVLMPDRNYYEKFTNNTSNLFIHHSMEGYMYLLNKLE